MKFILIQNGDIEKYKEKFELTMQKIETCMQF